MKNKEANVPVTFEEIVMVVNNLTKGLCFGIGQNQHKLHLATALKLRKRWKESTEENGGTVPKLVKWCFFHV